MIVIMRGKCKWLQNNDQHAKKNQMEIKFLLLKNNLPSLLRILKDT